MQQTPAPPKSPIPPISPPDPVASPLAPPLLQSPVAITSKRTFHDAVSCEQSKRQKMVQSIFTMIEYHIECQTIMPDEVIDFVSSLAPPVEDHIAPPVEDHIATAPTLQASSTVRSSSLQPTSTQTSAQSSTSFSETFTPINTAPGLSLHTCPAHLHEGLAVSHDPVQSIAKDSTHALLSSTGITPSCSADTLTPELDEIEHDDHGGDQSVEDEFSDPGVISNRTETWDADQSIEDDAMETETETETMDGDDSAGDDLSDEDFDMTQVETTEGDTSDEELSDERQSSRGCAIWAIWMLSVSFHC
jgi:hypothetical protein